MIMEIEKTGNDGTMKGKFKKEEQDIFNEIGIHKEF